MVRAHSSEIKAAAIAALKTGNTITHVAEAMGLPKSTVAKWSAQTRNLLVAADDTDEKRDELGRELYVYLKESIRALTDQLRVFGDGDWVRTQSAGDMALLHGVMADKTVRMLAAIRPESQPLVSDGLA